MKAPLSSLFVFINFLALSQPLVADFTFPSSLCKQENFKLTNQSIGAITYEWDLCPSELDNMPTGSVFEVSTGIPFKVDLVEENGKYFGFYTVRGDQKLYRLNFGTNIKNTTPLKTDLGNLGSSSLSPTGFLSVEIVKEGDQYYGFIIDFFNRIYRVSFGTSIENTPSNVEIIYNENLLNNPIDIVIVEDGNSKIAFIPNFGNGTVVRLDFGSSFNSQPASIIANAINHGFGGHGGISIIKDSNNSWYGVVSTSAGSLVRFFFEDGIDDLTPIISVITGVPASTSLFGLSIAFESNKYYVFVQSSTKLLRLNLGSTVADNVIAATDLGNFGLFTNVWGFSMHKVKSDWLTLSCENSSANIYSIVFPESCFTNISFSEEQSPVLTSEIEGTFLISLTIYNSDGDFSTVSKEVIFENKISPDINFESENFCSNHNVIFSSQNLSDDIFIYNWSFGDLNTSNLANPIYQFTNAGEYTVNLEVQASNGCNNFTEKTIKIYNPPSASFTLPTGLICTNNEFTFTNNTVDNFDDNLSFQWLLDDVPVSTDEDLLLTFTSGGDKELTLQASIPGCSSESVQIVTGVGEGPTVDFTLLGNCLNESTLLTNNSQGAIAGYSWDFGDGQTSTDLNPTVNYAAAGNYTVELETLGSNGCISKKSLPHQIFSVPQPNFNIDLPPFSCNGTPTQFNDLTPTLIDSNLDTWQWNFADQNASASIQHPQYTYALSGDYDVSLTVTSDQGCVATTNKIITISQSPQPVIINTPACVETAVVLQDGAATSASAWQWQVGNNFYFTESPSHVFATPGDYEISLTLTASNGCVGTTTKQVAVPLPLTVNFESAFNCANTATQFTAVVNDVADPVTNYSWFSGDVTRNGATVNYLYNTPGTEEVQLIATTQNGCEYTITKAITILPAPVADFSFTPGSGAPPLAVTFTNQSVNANSFLWEFNDVANTTSTLESPAFTFTDFGEYAIDLTATNAAGCESTVSKLIAVALPRVNVTLDNFRIIPNTDGSFLLLTNILNNGNVLVQNPKIEIRLDNAASLQEVLNTNIVAGSSVDYTLSTLVGANNNLNYACIRLVLPNNEAQENTEACITFEANTAITSPYPNPANELVTVEWISPIEETVSVMVNDYLGNVMATETISSQQGLNTLKLQTLDWQAGIYFIRIKSNSREHFFRTIITR
jgi:PKD repeat protein